MGFVSGYFRRRCLRREGSRDAAGFLPLGSIRLVCAVLGADDPGREDCERALTGFCRKNGMKLEVFYVDMRRPGRKVSPLTEAGKTFTRRDLNWYGKPVGEKAGAILGTSFDLFVCLADNSSFCAQYLSCTVRARFKIGLKPFPGDPYNFIVAPSAEAPASSSESFSAIADFLASIR